VWPRRQTSPANRYELRGPSFGASRHSGEGGRPSGVGWAAVGREDRLRSARFLRFSRSCVPTRGSAGSWRTRPSADAVGSQVEQCYARSDVLKPRGHGGLGRLLRRSLTGPQKCGKACKSASPGFNMVSGQCHRWRASRLPETRVLPAPWQCSYVLRVVAGGSTRLGSRVTACGSSRGSNSLEAMAGKAMASCMKTSASRCRAMACLGDCLLDEGLRGSVACARGRRVLAVPRPDRDSRRCWLDVADHVASGRGSARLVLRVP